MNYQLEIVTEKNIYTRFNEKKSAPNVVFRIKKDLVYPNFEYKNQYLNDIINQVKKNFIYSYFDSNSDSNTWINLKKAFEKINQKNLTTENDIEKSSLYQSNKSEFHEILFSDDNYNDDNEIEVTNNTPEELFRKELDSILSHYLRKSSLKLHGYFQTDVASIEEQQKWAKYLEWIYYSEKVIKKDFPKKMLAQIDFFSSPYYINLIDSIKKYEYEQINIDTSLVLKTMYILTDNKPIEFPKENIDEYFMDLVKLSKIAEYWIKHGSYIEANEKYPYYEEVPQGIITDFSDHIMSNLNHIIDSHILVEQQILESIKEEKEFFVFKKQYQILEPMIKTFFNKNDILNLYEVEFNSILENYYDQRTGSVKKFVVAGQCFYDQKLLMSIDIKDYYERDNAWFKKCVQRVFLHELGHAIDYAHRNNSKIFFLKEEKKYIKYSSHNEFKKLTKCVYRTTLGYTKKQHEVVDYFISPKVNLNPDGLITYQWDRACEETFADSFAFISSWLVNGLTQADTFTLQFKNSTLRIKIKTFMRALNFLLKHTNWEYLGICPRVLRNRKRMIKHFLNKIDNTPLVIRKNKYKNDSQKIHSYKKPMLKDLVS